MHTAALTRLSDLSSHLLEILLQHFQQSVLDLHHFGVLHVDNSVVVRIFAWGRQFQLWQLVALNLLLPECYEDRGGKAADIHQQHEVDVVGDSAEAHAASDLSLDDDVKLCFSVHKHISLLLVIGLLCKNSLTRE